MAHAGFSGVPLPADIVIYIRKADILGASRQSSHMHLQVLHTQQRLVEASDLLEKALPPDRTRSLPRTLMCQEAQQIVARILRMI